MDENGSFAKAKQSICTCTIPFAQTHTNNPTTTTRTPHHSSIHIHYTTFIQVELVSEWEHRAWEREPFRSSPVPEAEKDQTQYSSRTHDSVFYNLVPTIIAQTQHIADPAALNTHLARTQQSQFVSQFSENCSVQSPRRKTPAWTWAGCSIRTATRWAVNSANIRMLWKVNIKAIQLSIKSPLANVGCGKLRICWRLLIHCWLHILFLLCAISRLAISLVHGGRSCGNAHLLPVWLDWWQCEFARNGPSWPSASGQCCGVSQRRGLPDVYCQLRFGWYPETARDRCESSSGMGGWSAGNYRMSYVGHGLVIVAAAGESGCVGCAGSRSPAAAADGAMVSGHVCGNVCFYNSLRLIYFEIQRFDRNLY